MADEPPFARDVGDKPIIITETVANIPEGQEYPGSVVRWCAMCGDAVWLSPTALTAVDRLDVEPWCAACGIPHLQAMREAGEDVKVANRPGEPRVTRGLLNYLKAKYGRS